MSQINPQTTLQIVQYYANLLIFQYLGLPKAYNTILSSVTPIVMAQQSTQTITFSPAPTTGTFILAYGGVNATTINWNDSASTIQNDLQTIPSLSSVTVSGSISSGLTINFVGVTPVASLLTVFNNNLSSSGNRVLITIIETDVTLPLAIQNAFNINPNFGPIASGVQLDIIGQYAGVTRTTTTPTQTITLDDADFLTLIQFAIIQNNGGSSLADIENLMNVFFPNEFIVTDNKNMTLSYVLSATLGSPDLFTYLIQENLIPAPMGVAVNVIFVPPGAKDLFGFCTYDSLNPSAKPFNTYDDFNETWFFLTYDDAITP
jgi:Protein of unknown function (DUF2612)